MFITMIGNFYNAMKAHETKHFSRVKVFQYVPDGILTLFFLLEGIDNYC